MSEGGLELLARGVHLNAPDGHLTASDLGRQPPRHLAGAHLNASECTRTSITSSITRALLAALVVALAACGGAASTSQPHINGATVPPASQPPPAPSPVSTAATLTSQCAMGYELVPADSATGVFIAGPPPPGDVNGDGSVPDPALAYQVTLSSSSASTAQVTGFAVVFYDSGGAEAGSDQEQASGFITPGQALTWTVIEDHTVHGYGDDPNQQLAQTASIPASAATCQVVQWNGGGS